MFNTIRYKKGYINVSILDGVETIEALIEKQDNGYFPFEVVKCDSIHAAKIAITNSIKDK